jgi:transcriptional regulator with XRE-family HTH domain
VYTADVDEQGVPPVYRQIGKRIQQLRSLRVPPMSQTSLAAALNLSRASITNIENGRHRIQVHVLYGIAAELGVTIRELLPESLDRPAQYPFAQHVSDNERAAIERVAAPKKKGVRNARS